ncbi:alpha/beta fold hydrolase [Chloroflexota bacterium]
MIERLQNLNNLPFDNAVQSLKLKIGDCQAHYLKAGNGPPVVLLHGGASDSRDWLGIMAALNPSYTIYAPDLAGYGLSDRDDNGYYLSDFIEFTMEFIRTLGLDSHILVGHSIGGRVGLEIALRHPEMVSKLVLIDTVGFCKLSFLGGFLGAVAWGVRNLLRRPQPYPRFLKQKGEDRNWRCLDELPSLNVPTLIVWNSRDPYYPVSGALKAKELIPEARLEIFQGFGHAPHIQNGESFKNLLLGFLNHE